MVSYNEHYSGGYVGGGKALGGHGRCPQRRDLGMGLHAVPPDVLEDLPEWSHGRHYQGGTGAYETDGPKPIEHITEAVHGHFGGEE